MLKDDILLLRLLKYFAIFLCGYTLSHLISVWYIY